MRILVFSLIVTLLLTACMPRRYDSDRYELWVRLQVDTERMAAVCKTATQEQMEMLLDGLEYESRVLTVFEGNLHGDPVANQAIEIVADDFKEMREYYRRNQHSDSYCKLKTRLIIRKIKVINEILPTARQ